MSDPQHEPTMEEILASIRKIISEDGSRAALEAAPVPVAEEYEILELTQEVAPAPQASVFDPRAPLPEAAPQDEVVFQTVSSSDPGDIFSDHTRKAMDDAFASIPDKPDPATAPAPLSPIDGATVEKVFERAVRESFEPVIQKYLTDNSAAVIERMRPLIREWMDEHFPPLLEGAVRAEIERVAKARGAKR